ncbi:MAG: ComF family protein [Alphaproteobacteria bacterium]|nr:ComF family protein [Alphaproteobacteria bacterium]
MNNKLGIAAKYAADLVFPPQCLSCGNIISKHGGLCQTCFSRLHFLASPLCETCGRPLSKEAESWQICPHCSLHQPTAAKYRFALSYDEYSKELILPLKHGDKTLGVPLLAGFMVRAGSDILSDADALLPVPLHRFRLLHRKYNQSALLAKEIAKQTGITFLPYTLRRKKSTKSQGEFNASERKRNVKGAFFVRRPLKISGKNLVLIDDVMTTGATVNECTKELMQAGANQVSVLTLAAVL